jgi:SAM-dependent methyltransferase
MENSYKKEQEFWDQFYKNVDTEEIVHNTKIPYSILTPHRKFCYYEYFFYNAIKEFRNKRILSIGGGVDTFALYLAKIGNYVESCDISKEAVNVTSFLAQRLNVSGNLNAHLLNWEEEEINRKFEVVIIHEALHHMNTLKAITKIYDVLESGGCLIALEPICLLGIIQFFHKNFSFFPKHFFVHPEGEIDKELRVNDLNIIKRKFKNTTFDFFDVLARESVSYFLFRAGFHRTIKVLGSIDHKLTRTFPILKYLASYAVCKAYK